MSNPNATPLFGETDDKEDSKDSSTDSISPLSGKSFNFLLNPEDVVAKQAEEQSRKSFVEALLSKREASNDNEADEDSESAPSTKKSKRFRNSFKQVFTKVVGKDFGSDATSTNGKVNSSEPEASATLKIEHGLPALETPVAEDKTSEADTDSATVEVEPETESVAELAPEPALKQETEADPDPIAPEVVEEETVPPPPVTPPVSPPPPPPRPTTPAFGGAGGGVPPNIRMNAAGNTAPMANNPNNLSQPNQVTVIERGGVVGPLVAFLAANFLSKRRDKKIKREQNKIAKQVKNNQEQARLDRRRNATKENLNQQLHNQQEQRFSTIERTINAPEKKTAQIPDVEAPSNINNPVISQELNIHESKNAPQKMSEVIAEVARDKGLEVNIPNNLENPNVVQYEKEQTQKADRENELRRQQAQERNNKILQERRSNLKEVGDEKSQPILPQVESDPGREASVSESSFDRRHEVKDNFSTVLPATMASGALNQAGSVEPGKDVIKNPSAQSSSNQLQGQKSAPTREEQQQMYKQSIRVGVIVGAAFIILGSIAYLLFSG